MEVKPKGTRNRKNKHILNAGDKYGRLTFIKETELIYHKYAPKTRRADFQCECGNTCNKNILSVIYGIAKSCGCLAKEMQRQNLDASRFTHGLKNHPLYDRWLAIKQRCTNPKCSSYKNYGLRGIKVCDEWKDNFMTFYNWSIENGYTQDMHIDRIDNNGDYCPSNCRFVNLKENANNKRTNKYMIVNGQKVSFAQALSLLDLSEYYHKIYNKMKRGKSFEECTNIYLGLKKSSSATLYATSSGTAQM